MYPTLVQAHDEELKKRILISLQTRGVERLADAEIQVTGGIVLLSGRFPSTYEQHLALECCRHVAGVLRIEDTTKVDHEFEDAGVSVDRGPNARIGGYATFSAS